jgi:hypothetical protein
MEMSDDDEPSNILSRTELNNRRGLNRNADKICPTLASQFLEHGTPLSRIN